MNLSLRFSHFDDRALAALVLAPVSLLFAVAFALELSAGAPRGPGADIAAARPQAPATAVAGDRLPARQAFLPGSLVARQEARTSHE